MCQILTFFGDHTYPRSTRFHGCVPPPWSSLDGSAARCCPWSCPYCRVISRWSRATPGRRIVAFVLQCSSRCVRTCFATLRYPRSRCDRCIGTARKPIHYKYIFVYWFLAAVVRDIVSPTTHSNRILLKYIGPGTSVLSPREHSNYLAERLG